MQKLKPPHVTKPGVREDQGAYLAGRPRLFMVEASRLATEAATWQTLVLRRLVRLTKHSRALNIRCICPELGLLSVRPL